jgi:thiamine-phosphate pyrophosphorylase
VDTKLLAWGRRPAAHRLPRLWLFTDQVRLADPLRTAQNLPPGKAGIVFRHDDATERLALGIQLARICRQRRLMLVVAGDSGLAARLGAGVHLRGGRFFSPRRRRGFPITSSAHSVPDLLRASRSGACLAFLSPVFPTGSHPDAATLGPLRWAAAARRVPRSLAIGALGGVTGRNVHRLPRCCAAVGAISALSV